MKELFTTKIEKRRPEKKAPFMMMMMWMRRRIKFQSVDAIVLFDNKQLTIAALRIYHIYSSLTAHAAHPSGV